MKQYYKECKDLKQVNSFLKKVGLVDFEVDVDPLYAFNGGNNDFEFDSWTNDKETKGLSLLITIGCEVFISKYTRKDIEKIDNGTEIYE